MSKHLAFISARELPPKRRKLAVFSVILVSALAIFYLLYSLDGLPTKHARFASSTTAYEPLLSGGQPRSFDDLLDSVVHHANGERVINLYDTAISSYQDVFQLVRESQAPQSTRKLLSPDLIVITGVASTKPGLHLDRYHSLNRRLAATGHSSWYWQFGWSPPYNLRSWRWPEPFFAISLPTAWPTPYSQVIQTTPPLCHSSTF